MRGSPPQKRIWHEQSICEKSSSPPTSHHCTSSSDDHDTQAMYYHSSLYSSGHYHEVCEKFSPPPTSCHNRSSGANSPHGESYCNVGEQYSPLPLLITVGVQVPTVHMVKAIVMLVTVGVQGMTMECMVIQGDTGHHPMTVQWILENLQVDMYMTIHPL